MVNHDGWLLVVLKIRSEGFKKPPLAAVAVAPTAASAHVCVCAVVMVHCTLCLPQKSWFPQRSHFKVFSFSILAFAGVYKFRLEPSWQCILRRHTSSGFLENKNVVGNRC